jgi:hypothetical protein
MMYGRRFALQDCLRFAVRLPIPCGTILLISPQVNKSAGNLQKGRRNKETCVLFLFDEPFGKAFLSRKENQPLRLLPYLLRHEIFAIMIFIINPNISTKILTNQYLYYLCK